LSVTGRWYPGQYLTDTSQAEEFLYKEASNKLQFVELDAVVNKYGQWCPVAKATEILGEKWTVLIIRELLMGSTRFSQLQRGLGTISPTLLTKRLNMLDEFGLVYRRRVQGQKGFEYFPTDACRQLQPVILALGSWGMQWTRDFLGDADYDVELLMLYLERSILPDKLPGSKGIIRFRFTDFSDQPNWWITVDGENVDVCTSDPGLDVDVYITTTVKAMTDAWMGRTSYRQAKAEGSFDVIGPSALTRNISTWLSNCVFADLPGPEEILSLSGRTLSHM